MAIKVGKRCQIDENFEAIYKAVATKALSNLYDKMKGLPSARQVQFLSQRRGDVGRLNDVIKGISKPGRGLDLEMSRMRGLDFESVTVQDIAGKRWMVAQTRGLIITLRDYDYMEKVRGSKRSHTQYDHGDYKIYVDIATIGTTKIGELHFVPDLNPHATSRHYHHTASVGGEHPVQMWPHSCWGGFSGPLASALSLADLPELFRMLRIFVGRYNPGSPLSRPSFGRGKL